MSIKKRLGAILATLLLAVGGLTLAAPVASSACPAGQASIQHASSGNVASPVARYTSSWTNIGVGASGCGSKYRWSSIGSGSTINCPGAIAEWRVSSWEWKSKVLTSGTAYSLPSNLYGGYILVTETCWK